MIRTLLFSTLYPSGIRPGHGIFVETRLRQLLSSGKVESRVVAPVPWFPLSHPIFGDYGAMASVPARETRNDIAVEHPRYLLVPRLGMSSAPFSLAISGVKACRRLIQAGFDFDLIDAHYFYPDGVAAVMVGQVLRKPVVVTARGSDVNLLPRFRIPRRMILAAAEKCAGIVCVSGALKGALVQLGVRAEKINVLRNGVDRSLFFPESRAAAREATGATKFALASVGNLIPSKGHHLVIQALARLGDVELFIAGRGIEEANLRALASTLGVGDRVHFLGSLPQSRLRTLYSAVDCLVLASEREGWPNVLLEAMACGAPIVASRVGGIPEVLTEPGLGVLLEEQNSDAIVRAVETIRNGPDRRGVVHAHAMRFSWEETTLGQLALFERVMVPGRGFGRA